MIFEFMSVYSGQMPLVKLPFMIGKDVYLYEINTWQYHNTISNLKKPSILSETEDVDT